MITLLIGLGLFIFAGVYLYIWGVRAERERVENASLKHKVKVDSDTRKNSALGDDRVNSRRASVRKFMHEYLQANKVRKT